MFAVVLAADASNALAALARDFSPRIDVCSGREVVLDISGLDRLFGDARTLAGELRRTAADLGIRVRIAVASTRTAARLLVHHRAGVTIVERGTEAAALAPLPLRLFAVVPDLAGRRDPADIETFLATLRRWGLRTLGELAALPAADLVSRVGQDGARWQPIARGEDPRPLVPTLPEERFEQSIDLEWPIEGLEPLSFVLGRLMEPLAAHLERRDRGVAVLRVSLHLVTREVHERSLELPASMRDARTLRTLALLDLESHPPSAAIDRVVVAAEPTPARVLQFSLLTRPIPAPEQLSTLIARLSAVMGEGRCGSPALVDSWAPGACTVAPFAPRDVPAPQDPCAAHDPVVALRRFRYPVPARVRTEHGRPVHLITDRRSVSGGAVVTSAGPWRTSGGWWSEQPATRHQSPAPNWDRDEWEVTLGGGISYRVFRERSNDAWFVDAVID